MQANSEVMRAETDGLTVAWEETRGWAEEVFARDRMVWAGTVGTLLGLVGLVGYSLYQALQNWSVSGVGPAVLGFF